MSEFVVGKVEFGEKPEVESRSVSYCGYDREEIEDALGVSSVSGTISFKPEDTVNNSRHYTKHPSGVECIQITEHMGFNLGNAMKYIWRADLKGNAIEDLGKSAWYIKREIEKRKKNPA